MAEISSEIEKAKRRTDPGKDYLLTRKVQALLSLLPRRLVILVFRTLIRNHARVSELSGTVFVTSVSMAASVPGYIVPYIGGPKACSFAIGSAMSKPAVRDDGIEAREMINITAAFNHDIIDGAQAGRFIGRLRRWIERESELLM